MLKTIPKEKPRNFFSPDKKEHPPDFSSGDAG